MKKRIFYLLFIVFISLSACKGDRGEHGSEAQSKAVTEEISEVSPDILKKKISSEKGFFQMKQLEKFYSKRNYKPLWTEADALHSFYNSLSAAGEEGLNYSDYHGKEIDSLLSLDKLKPEKAADLDLLLSDAFLTYAKHLYYGKLDPEKLNEFWGITRQPKDFQQLLLEATERGEVAAVLEDLKPKHAVYNSLKKNLRKYKELRKEESPKAIAEGEVIEPGQKDARISAIAGRLRELGDLNQNTSEIDSTYTEELVAAIKEFQQSKSIQTDGIIGNATIAELNKGPKERYLQILANLERWRWYPRDLGEHYILVNIPNFKLKVVKDGKTIREHNIIAGAKERQTPIFSDTIDHLVINPTWTIPPTIREQDVLPKAAANSSYLASKDMVVTGPGGESIDPAKVNWSSNKAKSYSITQRAGASNPLGRVKIMYPNKYFIYLHDTPAKSLFNQSQRAESSGCVRVENALDLAAYVVENQSEWTRDRIDEVIETGNTTTVKVDRPIQVHHFYWTAWGEDDNAVFVNDVYDLDKQIYEQLQNKS